jgi:integrase
MIGRVVWIDRQSSTLAPLAAAIDFYHRQAQVSSPTDDAQVKALIGLLRTAEQPQTQRARPLRLSVLDEIAANPPAYQSFERDWTVLLLGFFGAFRSSELTGIRVEDLTFDESGLVVTLYRSKSNPLGVRELIPIASRPDANVCAVDQLHTWVHQQTPGQGWLFPSGRGDGHVGTRTIQDAVRRVTNNGEAAGSPYTSHSMRRGFCTEAIEAGISLTLIALKARHRSLESTMKYLESSGPGTAAMTVSRALGQAS